MSHAVVKRHYVAATQHVVLRRRLTSFCKGQYVVVTDPYKWRALHHVVQVRSPGEPLARQARR